jgi:hypothetical protein
VLYQRWPVEHAVAEMYDYWHHSTMFGPKGGETAFLQDLKRLEGNPPVWSPAGQRHLARQARADHAGEPHADESAAQQ